MIAGDPLQGGAAWAVLQYVVGLRRLGYDVWLVDPVDAITTPRARSFGAIVSEFELEQRAALLCGGRTIGVSRDRLLDACRSADVLLNVSGMLTDDELLAAAHLRVWLDLDPGFNQLWHSTGVDMRFTGHDRFVTVGQRIGCHDCDVPTCGHDWTKTLPPVVLEHWAPGADIVYDGLTTVGNWRAYGSIEYEGRCFRQKAHSVRAIISLPALTEVRIMPALSIHPDEHSDLAALGAHGWNVLDPEEVTPTPSAYRAFVRSSKAELGIAKEGYAVSRCGWFSDRSACYLAAGRPVVAQDTGFDGALPTGDGLLTYDSVTDAAEAIDRVCIDYARHSRAARELAEAHLDSDRVLTGLLEAL